MLVLAVKIEAGGFDSSDITLINPKSEILTGASVYLYVKHILFLIERFLICEKESEVKDRNEKQQKNQAKTAIIKLAD